MNAQGYALLGAALILVFLVVLPSWRRGVAVLFGWLILEDIVRRVIPGQPFQVQLVKETILLGTYVSFFMSFKKQGRSLWMPPFLPALLSFAVVVILDSLNPELRGFLIPALGIRSYLWYVPLLWLGYYHSRWKQEAHLFVRRLVYLALPLATLGVVQYVLWEQLPGWLRPLEGAHAYHSATIEFGGGVLSYESKLPSSVFGSAHRFAMFSLFSLFLGIGLWGWRLTSSKPRRRALLGAGILASIVCVVVAGARMGMGLTVVGLLLLTLPAVLSRRRHLRVRLRQVLAGVVFAAVFIAVLFIFQDTGRFFLYTTTGDVPTHWEQFTRDQLPMTLKKAAWFGFGTGALSQGLTYVPGGEEMYEFARSEAEEVGVEYGLAKVIWELGVLGLLAFLFLWGCIFLSLWQGLRALHDSEIKGLAQSLGVLVLLVFIAFLKGHQYFGDGTTLVLTWFSLGMFFSLRRVERIEEMRRNATLASGQ